MLPPKLPRHRAHVVVAAAIVLLFLTGNSWAQSSRYRREIVFQSQIADVPLQPFLSHDRSHSPSAIQVAYYTPHTLPRTQRIDEDDAESSTAIGNSGSHPITSGDRALLRHGVAYAPSNAPDRVKNAIWAINTIRNRPYVWGGGHGSFHDSGYDCSGTVSYALHYAGALNQPLASNELTRFGERGRGRWITIYSRRGHTFAVIAGLRLDTTDFHYGGNVGPRWHEDGRDTWGYEARHPAKL